MMERELKHSFLYKLHRMQNKYHLYSESQFHQIFVLFQASAKKIQWRMKENLKI